MGTNHVYDRNNMYLHPNSERMGITLDQIATYLAPQGLAYQVQSDKSRILVRLELPSAENFLVVIQLDEDGRFFKLFAPEVLAGVKEHPHKTAILQTMLSISWETKMLQWEYDPSDGEIRAIIEFPLEDSTLTDSSKLSAIGPYPAFMQLWKQVWIQAMTMMC
jgi:hypothetical protein